MRNNKVECLLQSPSSGISLAELSALKQEYWALLEQNKFEFPGSTHAVEVIRHLKRRDPAQVRTIGCYRNISLFEAANRIATDLVIITGIIQLVESNAALLSLPITIRLGTAHQPGRGDFSIGTYEGEAFNVSESFLAAKLYQTRKKWRGKELTYILINDDAFVSGTPPADTTIIRVRDWDKP